MTCGDRAFQHLGKVFPDRQQADPSTQMGRSIETMINGALEMPRSLAAVAGRKSNHFTAPTERSPSRESANDGHSFIATMINGALEMPQSLAAVAGRKSTPFHGADGAGALQGIGQ
jgi:hypothetical protein